MMVFLASGALCGLAGAQLALAQTTEFTEGMTAGRGYIALVALLVAGTNVWAVAGVAIAFGILQSVSSQLQSLGVASQLIEAIPFVLGFIALVGVHLAQTLARTRRTKVALAVSMRTYGDGRSHADISVVDARPGGPPSAR
jgi:simple sugar transport system permease protein